MSDSLRFRWALAGLLAAAGPTAAFAQNTSGDNTSYGTTAAEFLLLGASARGAALGTPFAAIANDVSALYYNPAGIALQRTSQFQASAYDYVAETDYAWGGLSFPFDGRSKAVGFQFGTFGFGDQPIYTVDQPDGTGAVYSVSETFVGATYAQNFSDRFSAGLTAKFIFDNLGGAKGNAFAVDFGTNFHSRLGGHPINFSFTLQNLGTDLSYTGDPLFVDVPRDSVPGVGSVPTTPQPGELRTKGFNLPTVFRVAEVLAKAGLTQAALARQTGLGVQTINRLCNNTTAQVSLHTLDRIATVLSVEPGDLIVREASRKKRGP